MSDNNNQTCDQATGNTEYDHNDTLNANSTRNNNNIINNATTISNNNRERNSNRRSTQIYNTRDSKFTGANINIPTLKSKAETSVSGAKQNNYVRFKEKLLAYVLQNYKNALDIVPCIRDYADANKMLFQNAPSKQVIRNAMGIVVKRPEAGETEEEEKIRIAFNMENDSVIEGIFQAQLKSFVEREHTLRTNKASLWSLIIGQCSPALVEQLKSETGFKNNEMLYEPVWLLNTIKKVLAGATDTTNTYYALYHTLKDFYKIRQQRDESIEDYYLRFDQSVSVINLTAGQLLFTDTLLTQEQRINSSATTETVLQKFLAMAFLECADSNRFHNLWKSLKTDMAMGNDRYPTSLNSATSSLQKWAKITNRSDSPIVRTTWWFSLPKLEIVQA